MGNKKSNVEAVNNFTLRNGEPCQIKKGTIISVLPFAEILQPGDKEATHCYSTIHTPTRDYVVNETAEEIWASELA